MNAAARLFRRVYTDIDTNHTGYPISIPICMSCLTACALICHVSDLEWKLIYVGSAEDEKCDQELESVLVGPVNCGTFRFVFQVKKTMGVHMIHVSDTM